MSQKLEDSEDTELPLKKWWAPSCQLIKEVSWKENQIVMVRIACFYCSNSNLYLSFKTGLTTTVRITRKRKQHENSEKICQSLHCWLTTFTWWRWVGHACKISNAKDATNGTWCELRCIFAVFLGTLFWSHFSFFHCNKL